MHKNCSERHQLLKVAITAKSVLLTPNGAQKLPSAIETGISGNEELAEVGEGGKEGQRDLTDLRKF